jgi:hypothetical protein
MHVSNACNYIFSSSADGLPAVNAIQVMTTSNVEFCTIKCLDYSGCKSIVFLLLNSDDNCLLSDEINGAQSSSASVTYIKTSHVTSVRNDLNIPGKTAEYISCWVR